MALFMQSLDATILNTALPSIASDLHEPAFEMQMAIIAYSLSVALFIPLTAWAVAKFSTLTVFRSAVATFVLGSIGCAFAPNLNALVLARVVQGIGGAFMMPVALLAIIQVVPKQQLLNAWNLMAFLSVFQAQACHFCYRSCFNFHLVIVQKCRAGCLHRLR